MESEKTVIFLYTEWQKSILCSSFNNHKQQQKPKYSKIKTDFVLVANESELISLTSERRSGYNDLTLHIVSNLH